MFRVHRRRPTSESVLFVSVVLAIGSASIAMPQTASQSQAVSDQLQSSLRSGDIDTALTAATKLQKEIDSLRAESRPVPLPYMNVYNINDALGRSAFLRQDFLSASDYLIRASEVDGGSPAMTTFGPDMWLAQALLKAGYRDVVKVYFMQCRTFWTKDILGQYIDELERGGTPDLSKNVFSNAPIKSR